MILLPRVKLAAMSPQIALALYVADKVRDEFDSREITVTSVCDGAHSHTSLHYIGHAADIRTRDIDTEMQRDFTDTLIEKLGAEFDVVLESDHIHIEYQPKL